MAIGANHTALATHSRTPLNSARLKLITRHSEIDILLTEDQSGQEALYVTVRSFTLKRSYGHDLQRGCVNTTLCGDAARR
jgi:hypothetical protein